MSLSTKLNTSYELFQRSLQVLRTQPRLMLFPVVSTAFTLVLVAFFLTPVAVLVIQVHNAGGDWDATAQRLNTAFYAYGAVIYLSSMVVATFFNVAFYNEIIRSLAGEPVSLAGGLRFAWSRIRAILLWSLLAATVGLIIRSIEERLGWLGKIVMGFVGAAWSVAAVFAIPVLIRREDSNPVAVLRDSAATLKRTWGESLAGYVGIQFGSLVIAFVVLVGVIAAGVVGALTNWYWISIVMIGTCVVFAIAAGFILGLAGHVYRCALYVYATEGVVPGPFTPELMNAGWKVKKETNG